MAGHGVGYQDEAPEAIQGIKITSIVASL